MEINMKQDSVWPLRAQGPSSSGLLCNRGGTPLITRPVMVGTVGAGQARSCGGGRTVGGGEANHRLHKSRSDYIVSCNGAVCPQEYCSSLQASVRQLICRKHLSRATGSLTFYCGSYRLESLECEASFSHGLSHRTVQFRDSFCHL